MTHVLFALFCLVIWENRGRLFNNTSKDKELRELLKICRKLKCKGYMSYTDDFGYRMQTETILIKYYVLLLFNYPIFLDYYVIDREQNEWKKVKSNYKLLKLATKEINGIIESSREEKRKTNERLSIIISEALKDKK